ncbi:MAG: radical SAM protein [Promethearchaeota archaeon]|nr:MAG: radical SAM protein [Candidatus Lokiarchaeota archaeon]
MLNAIHFLLTYACNFECDHCFLYCGPNSKGTFTLAQIKDVLDEAYKINTIECIYFEGGEPFLYYALMLEAARLATEMGFKIGIVTNSYWATCEEDAKFWLKNFTDINLSDFSVSDDDFHYGENTQNLSIYARNAAKSLNFPTGSISIEKPGVYGFQTDQEKGKPVEGGEIMFRGRAVEKLIENVPRRNWEDLKKCPYEDLEGLGRVHVDSFGNMQICQGLSIGNFWNIPLSEIVNKYKPEQHPICGPLLKGGPAQLIKEYNVEHEESYVDECHLCYCARKSLLNKYPEFLGPKQVYGL